MHYPGDNLFFYYEKVAGGIGNYRTEWCGVWRWPLGSAVCVSFCVCVFVFMYALIDGGTGSVTCTLARVLLPAVNEKLTASSSEQSGRKWPLNRIIVEPFQERLIDSKTQKLCAVGDNRVAESSRRVVCLHLMGIRDASCMCSPPVGQFGIIIVFVSAPRIGTD